MFLYVRLDTHLYVRTLGYMNVRTHGSRRTVSPGPATRRTWLGLAVLLVPALLVSKIVGGGVALLLAFVMERRKADAERS